MDDNFRDEVMRSLGRIEGKLEELATVKANTSALAVRVAALESWRSYLTGAWFVGAAGFAYVIKLFYGNKA